MSTQRLRLILTISLIALALLFFGIAISGRSMLLQGSQELVELKQQSKTVDSQLANLAASKKQVEKYAYFNTVAKTVIPSDKDQAQAVLDINNLAGQSGIVIANISFPASTLGSKTTTPSKSNAATASSKTVISQAKAVEGINGLYSLELTVTPQTGAGIADDKKVTYSKFLDFLSRIERNRRTAQISQVSITPETAENGPSQFIDFSLSINIFMKP